MKSAYQFFVQDSNGVSQPHAQITVRRNGSLVPIFSDKGGTSKSNPFQATDDAYALFYADSGTYNIRADFGGQSFEFVDVQIGTQTVNNVVQRYYLTDDTTTVSKSGAIFGASVYVDGDYLPPDNGDEVVNWEITNNELGTITFTPAITASVGSPKTLTVYWYSETNDAVLDLQGGLITYYQSQFDDFIADKDAEANDAIAEYKLKNKGNYGDGPTLLEDGFEYVVFAATGKSYFAVNPPYTTDPTTYPDPDTDTNLVEQSYMRRQDTNTVATAGDQCVTGLIMHPIDPQQSASVNDNVAGGTTALRDTTNRVLYKTSAPVTGLITALDFAARTATVGGTAVTLYNATTNGADIGRVATIQYKASVGRSAVDNMVAGDPLVATIGDICTTGTTSWLRTSVSAPSVLSDFVILTPSCPYDFGWSNLGDVAQNTLSLQSAINTSPEVVILQAATVSQINLKSNLTLTFKGPGKLQGVAGSKILTGTSISKTRINNPNIEGVYDPASPAPNLAEHGIDLRMCTDVTVQSPRGKNIGGNNITCTECVDVTVNDLQCDGVGFLGAIFVDCTRAKLNGAIGKQIHDAFAFQSKGGTSDELNDVTTFAPNSSAVICNTNLTSGRISDGCKIRRPKVYNDNTQNPGPTKGAIVYQGINGVIDTPEVRGLTKLEGITVFPGTDNLHIISPQIENLTNIGIDILLDVGTVIIDSPITKGMQDRGIRAQSGRIYINGGEVTDNGQANVPNLEFIDWEDFVIDGMSFKQSVAGAAKSNIKLGASTSKGLITSNTFERESAPDVITATGEFRTDCPNVDLHSNHNCFVQVTTGWTERFEIKNGQIVPSGYSRATAPATGTWVRGDVIPYSNIAIGTHSEYVCVAPPATFGVRGTIS